MGRKVAINGEAISGSSTCNLLDSFGYTPGIGNGDKYIDPARVLPGKWKGKQLGTSTPKWGTAGALGPDGLFEKEFKRAYVGDGGGIASNDINKRDAYTNTIQTERLREKVKTELRVARKTASPERLLTATQSFEHSRRSSMEFNMRSPSPVLEQNNFTSRKFRPTASAQYGARHSNHYAALYNAQMYLPAIGTMPAAYQNPCSHAPVVQAKMGDGFYRKQGSMRNNTMTF